MASCPQCGSSMAVRYRRVDGRPFLGCTRYPACRGTRGYSNGGQRRPGSSRPSAPSTMSPSPPQITKARTSNWPGAVVGLVLVAALVGWCSFGSRTAVSGQGGSDTPPSSTFAAPRTTVPPFTTIRAAPVINTTTPSATRTAASLTPRTAAPVLPASGPTAHCRDGTYSYSANHRGTCSHHGGVAVWYR
jgi:ssDNA-binding Zn-finger/Zn-ribbon topoisomerase 1